jgi:GT2 family glycosyltransferase
MSSFDHLTSRDVEQPATSAAVVRASDFRAVGGFDTELKVFFTDVELCRRLGQRGRKLRYVADAEVFHHQGGSAQVATNRNLLWQRDRIAFYEKFHGQLGAAWIRGVVRLQETELLARIALGPRPPKAKLAAMREVRAESRAILSR